MGTDVPVLPLDLVPEKWYACYLDAYWQPDGPRDCTMLYLHRIVCCQTGANILQWIQEDWECEAGKELCFDLDKTAQRLVAVHGPYDTGDICWAAHGP